MLLSSPPLVFSEGVPTVGAFHLSISGYRTHGRMGATTRTGTFARGLGGVQIQNFGFTYGCGSSVHCPCRLRFWLRQGLYESLAFGFWFTGNVSLYLE